tara:strand:- start:999 stop:1358 length:360 start_codon:yes stop_codon:yes gene_type:complete
MNNKLHFSLHEKEQENEVPTYDELVKQVDMMELSSDANIDDMIAVEIDYQTNYTKKDLDKIAEYYGINKRQKKTELIENIVLFEKDQHNIEIVYKRKKLWSYLEEIKSDKYLSRYLIFD